ncbi:hypothetical protein IMG5_051570, partial [Ichthyophthirius multifiliis]
NINELEEYIEVIFEHQINCEKQGKYIEAEQARNKVKQLKLDLEKRRKEEIKNKHINEKLGIEKAHLEEFNQFNAFWDQKMNEFNEEASKIEQELIQRQQQEYIQVQEELQKVVPYKPKQSAEALNLMKIEENLAKQKNYVEAHQVQEKRNYLEKQENQQWLQVRDQKIKNQLNQLKNKQQNELNALKQRIIAGQDEQRKNRSIELERLLQKYQNVKKELEIQQQMEANQFIKQQKNKNSNNNSKVNGSRSMKIQ